MNSFQTNQVTIIVLIFFIYFLFIFVCGSIFGKASFIYYKDKEKEIREKKLYERIKIKKLIPFKIFKRKLKIFLRKRNFLLLHQSLGKTVLNSSLECFLNSSIFLLVYNSNGRSIQFFFSSYTGILYYKQYAT